MGSRQSSAGKLTCFHLILLSIPSDRAENPAATPIDGPDALIAISPSLDLTTAGGRGPLRALYDISVFVLWHTYRRTGPTLLVPGFISALFFPRVPGKSRLTGSE